MQANTRRAIINIIPCDKHYNARMYKVHGGEQRKENTFNCDRGDLEETATAPQK